MLDPHRPHRVVRPQAHLTGLLRLQLRTHGQVQHHRNQNLQQVLHPVIQHQRMVVHIIHLILAVL